MVAPYEIQEKEKHIAAPCNAFQILLRKKEYGIHIVFPESENEDVLLQELLRMSCDPALFASKPGIVPDLQGRRISADFLLRILSEFAWPNNLHILSWISCNEETLALLHAGGFAVGEPAAETLGKSRSSSDLLVLMQSLRAGQRVEHPGDVILFGNINEGAEICAAGSVFVHGRLKGLVHAGTGGGECSITAKSFEAVQVRLGNKFCTTLGDDPRWQHKSVVISMENDALIAREFNIRSSAAME